MNTMRFGIAVPVVVAACLVAGASMAQNHAMRERLFKQADEQFDAARVAKVDVLAPKGYGEAMSDYDRAETKFLRGEDVEGIRRGVARARAELRRATEAAEIARISLSAPLNARTGAEAANAAKYSPELWAKAEEKFAWAVNRLESGSIKQAQSYGTDAEAIFRDAELVAIKANYLAGARDLLQQAKQARVDRYAPKTLERARNLLARAELELTASRYDLESPRRLAREAQYEASHAIYLAGIVKSAKARQVELEDLLLDLETPVKDIGASLDIEVAMDKGYQIPTTEILREIAELRRSYR